MDFHMQSGSNLGTCLSILDDNAIMEMDFTSQSESILPDSEDEDVFSQFDGTNSNDKVNSEEALLRKLDKCLILYEVQPCQVLDEEDEFILQSIKNESLLLKYTNKQCEETGIQTKQQPNK